MNVKTLPTTKNHSSQKNNDLVAEAIARTPPIDIRNLVITSLMAFGLREEAAAELIGRNGLEEFSHDLKRTLVTEDAQLKEQWRKLAAVFERAEVSTVSADIRLRAAALVKMAGLVWFVGYVNSKE